MAAAVGRPDGNVVHDAESPCASSENPAEGAELEMDCGDQRTLDTVRALGVAVKAEMSKLRGGLTNTIGSAKTEDGATPDLMVTLDQVRALFENPAVASVMERQAANTPMAAIVMEARRAVGEAVDAAKALSDALVEEEDEKREFGSAREQISRKDDCDREHGSATSSSSLRHERVRDSRCDRDSEGDWSEHAVGPLAHERARHVRPASLEHELDSLPYQETHSARVGSVDVDAWDPDRVTLRDLADAAPKRGVTMLGEPDVASARAQPEPPRNLGSVALLPEPGRNPCREELQKGGGDALSVRQDRLGHGSSVHEECSRRTSGTSGSADARVSTQLEPSFGEPHTLDPDGARREVVRKFYEAQASLRPMRDHVRNRTNWDNASVHDSTPNFAMEQDSGFFLDGKHNSSARSLEEKCSPSVLPTIISQTYAEPEAQEEFTTGERCLRRGRSSSSQRSLPSSPHYLTPTVSSIQEAAGHVVHRDFLKKHDHEADMMKKPTEYHERITHELPPGTPHYLMPTRSMEQLQISRAASHEFLRKGTGNTVKGKGELARERSVDSLHSQVSHRSLEPPPSPRASRELPKLPPTPILRGRRKTSRPSTRPESEVVEVSHRQSSARGSTASPRSDVEGFDGDVPELGDVNARRSSGARPGKEAPPRVRSGKASSLTSDEPRRRTSTTSNASREGKCMTPRTGGGSRGSGQPPRLSTPRKSEAGQQNAHERFATPRSPPEERSAPRKAPSPRLSSSSAPEARSGQKVDVSKRLSGSVPRVSPPASPKLRAEGAKDTPPTPKAPRASGPKVPPARSSEAGPGSRGQNGPHSAASSFGATASVADATAASGWPAQDACAGEMLDVSDAFRSLVDDMRSLAESLGSLVLPNEEGAAETFAKSDMSGTVPAAWQTPAVAG